MKYRIVYTKDGNYHLEYKRWLSWCHVQWYDNKDAALLALSSCVDEDRARKTRKDTVICEEKV